MLCWCVDTSIRTEQHHYELIGLLLSFYFLIEEKKKVSVEIETRRLQRKKKSCTLFIRRLFDHDESFAFET